MPVQEVLMLVLLTFELAFAIFSAAIGKYKSAFWFLCAAAAMLLAYYFYNT